LYIFALSAVCSQRWFAVFLNVPTSAGAVFRNETIKPLLARWRFGGRSSTRSRRQELDCHGDAVVRSLNVMFRRKQKYQHIKLQNPMTVLRHKQQKA